MPIDVTELSVRADTRSVVMHDMAMETIQNMFDQCEKIREHFGPYDEYDKAVRSLHNCLSKVLLRTGFGRCAYVTRETDRSDKLSLFVQEDGFVFGVIFFRDRTYDGTDREGIPGEWSCHS